MECPYCGYIDQHEQWSVKHECYATKHGGIYGDFWKMPVQLERNESTGDRFFLKQSIIFGCPDCKKLFFWET